MNVNLYGVIDGCRAFGAPMVERSAGGHIVNVAAEVRQALPAQALHTRPGGALPTSERISAELQ